MPRQGRSREELIARMDWAVGIYLYGHVGITQALLTAGLHPGSAWYRKGFVRVLRGGSLYVQRTGKTSPKPKLEPKPPEVKRPAVLSEEPHAEGHSWEEPPELRRHKDRPARRFRPTHAMRLRNAKWILENL